MKPLKIFGWAADHGGCGNYRLGLPMWALAEAGHDAVAFTSFNVMPPADLDILVGQRIGTPEHAAHWAALARSERSYAMVYEVDDDLWNLQPSNPAYDYWQGPPRELSIASIRLADAVTVTTDHLAEVLSRYNPNVFVLPNCFDASVLDQTRPVADRLTVGWAGGSSHADDFASVQKDVRTFFRRSSDVDVHFIGVNHAADIGRPDARHTPWLGNLADYLRGLDFDLGIAPLAFNEFNRSKSDLKFLEYASLGIPVVASNFGPYAETIEHGVTGMLVTYPHEWAKYLNLLTKDDDLRAEIGANARAWSATRTIQGNAWRWENAYNTMLGRPATAVGPDVSSIAALLKERGTSAPRRSLAPAGDRPLSHERFIVEDKKTPKDDNVWAFPVCAFDHLLTGNDRAVFEAVKDDPTVRKVVLTRSKEVVLDGVNVDIVPLSSLAGQRLLMQSRYVFVKHSPRVNVPYPMDATTHRFINLWHGIPLKRIGVTSLDNQDKLEWTEAENGRCHAVIASSKMDRLAMATAFAPLHLDDMWLTGLPRNDVVLAPEPSLPDDFRAQLARLRETLAGRRLVLFAPTFRNAQSTGYFQFDAAQRAALAACLDAHGAVLGIREHMADTAQSYSQQLTVAGAPVISLDRTQFAEIELLYREADLLITDYSSCFVDFMLTGKPEISFAYDHESYATSERGLFYNLAEVFPGPVCQNFDALLTALDQALRGDEIEPEALYAQKRRMFFEYLDHGSSARLVARVRAEIAAA